MKQIHVVSKDALTFIGLPVQTNFNNETSPQTAKIGHGWQQFFAQHIFDKIPNKIDSKFCYGVYTNYHPNEYGSYRVTIGAAVTDDKTIPHGLQVTQLPASKYLVFSSHVGQLPQIVAESWMFIWQFFKDHPEYSRTYTGDFEQYHLQVVNFMHQAVDIYIAIK